MSYVIKRITVQANKAWSVLSDHHILIQDLLKNYYDGFIDYRHDEGFFNRQVNIQDIPGITDYAKREEYLDDFLLGFDEDIIPTIPISQTRNIMRPKAIQYSDFWDYGFHAENSYPQTGKDTDLYITKTERLVSQPASYIDRVLFMVDNRIMFPTVRDTHNLLIEKGYLKLNKKNRQYLGVIDFSAVGGFTQEIITEDQLELKANNGVYSTIQFTSQQNLQGKTVFLITNGHLHKLDTDYSVGQNNKVGIRLKHVDIIERADSPREEYDWVKPAGFWIGFDVSSVDPIKYLSRGNSALIIVNQPGLSIHEEYLQRTGMGDHYTHYRVPRGILYLADGTVGNYRLHAYDYDLVALGSSPPKAFNAMSNFEHPINVTTITHQRSPQVTLQRTAKLVDYYYL